MHVNMCMFSIYMFCPNVSSVLKYTLWRMQPDINMHVINLQTSAHSFMSLCAYFRCMFFGGTHVRIKV
jgi:hypothetical protein